MQQDQACLFHKQYIWDREKYVQTYVITIDWYIKASLHLEKGTDSHVFSLPKTTDCICGLM